MAESIRQSLEREGLQGPQRIGVLTSDGVQTYAAILAILANGGTYVPINSNSPIARNQSIVDEAGITGLVYDPADESISRMAAGLGVGRKILPLRFATIPKGDSLHFRGEDVSNPAYLLFTSGSTGKPKGVPIGHENLNNFMAVMLDSGIYDFHAADRFLQMFELTFDLSVMSLFVPLSIGACCYVVPDSSFGAATILKVLEEYEISAALMVPSMLVFLEPYLETKIRLPSMRHSMFCGEALPDSLVQKWQLAAPNSTIENLYGPTEATIFCLRYLWDPAASPAAAVNGIVPIGTPLPGTDVLLADEFGQPISESGVKGELLLMGAQLATGYWQDAEKTAAAFINVGDKPEAIRAYRTGDLCSLNAQGDFIYHGRIDSQVKIDGHRVELGEIEHHVRDVLNRSNIAVVAASKGGRNFLALFVEESEIDLQEVTNALKARVPGYMIPTRLECIDKLPLNLSGKVDRPILRKRLNDS